MGFWTTLVGALNQELTFIVAREFLADRQSKWTAYETDPDWLAARAESQRDGEIIANAENTFLAPTAFDYPVKGGGQGRQQQDVSAAVSGRESDEAVGEHRAAVLGLGHTRDLGQVVPAGGAVAATAPGARAFVEPAPVG